MSIVGDRLNIAEGIGDCFDLFYGVGDLDEFCVGRDVVEHLEYSFRENHGVDISLYPIKHDNILKFLHKEKAPS